MGMTGYFRKFIKAYGTTARPLQRLTKSGVQFVWGEEEQGAFEELRARLVEAPVLVQPKWDEPMVLVTDASAFGAGAAMVQEREGKWRVVEYASKELTETERRYSTTDREMLALVWGTRKFRQYLFGTKVTAYTDHECLTGRRNIDDPTGRTGRWMGELMQYGLEVKKIRGRIM